MMNLRRRVQRLSMVFLLSAQAFAQDPRIFYSDLNSGPNTGGQSNAGAFVTIYGKGFGDVRGSAIVTIGGKPAAGYPIWTDSKITFQLSQRAQSGNIVVTIGGHSSNGAPFAVRPGKIRFVSPSGSDHNSGGFNSPWRTVVKAVKAIGPGDIAYVMNGVEQTAADDYDASLEISSAGQPGRSKALVAYPGAHPNIGSERGPAYAIRTPDIHTGPFSHWILAGFTLRGRGEGISLVSVSDWRLVANDVSCPNGDGVAACVEVERSTNIKVLGNYIHNVGKVGASKKYHSLYFTTDSNHIEVGWNAISNNHSCRGIQFHSSPDGSNTGFNQYDLIVHDNIIHGQVCDGINFATIDPSKGPVLAYNNLIYHVGTGPDAWDGGANYACISSPGTTNNGPPGSGTAQWMNNTLYDCGSRRNDNSGAFDVERGSPSIQLSNNIVYQLRGENYLEPVGDSALIKGSNNLWYGGNSLPDGTSNNLTIDPKFVDLGKLDFHLEAGSPAIRSGECGSSAPDLDGIPRHKNGPCSLGAFQFAER